MDRKQLIKMIKPGDCVDFGAFGKKYIIKTGHGPKKDIFIVANNKNDNIVSFIKDVFVVKIIGKELQMQKKEEPKKVQTEFLLNKVPVSQISTALPSPILTAKIPKKFRNVLSIRKVVKEPAKKQKTKVKKKSSKK